MISIMLVFVQCRQSSNDLLNNTVKFALISNIEEIEKNEKCEYLDSIVFLYSKINKEKTYVCRTVWASNKHSTNYYYLFKTDTVTYIGLEDIDKILYQPYYSNIKGGKCFYNFEYVVDGSGSVIFEDIFISEKVYKGDIFLLNFSESPIWKVDSLEHISEIQVGDLKLIKTNKEFYDFPKSYCFPTITINDIFQYTQKNVIVNH